MKVFLLALAALVATLVTAPLVTGAATKAPVIALKSESFGRVLATPKHQALYYWTREKRAGFKIRCTGACLQAWPPVIVRSAASVPKRIAGVRGIFGVIRRPDGRLQVTRNRLPLYSYAHEGPDQVLCNNVDGWFVVRA